MRIKSFLLKKSFWSSLIWVEYLMSGHFRMLHSFIGNDFFTVWYVYRIKKGIENELENIFYLIFENLDRFGLTLFSFKNSWIDLASEPNIRIEIKRI